MVGKICTVVGSVYIPPGDIVALGKPAHTTPKQHRSVRKRTPPSYLAN